MKYAIVLIKCKEIITNSTIVIILSFKITQSHSIAIIIIIIFMLECDWVILNKSLCKENPAKAHIFVFVSEHPASTKVCNICLQYWYPCQL